MNSEPQSSYTLFEWYQAGKWEDIQQGDILAGCPVLAPSEKLTEALLGTLSGAEVVAPYTLTLSDLIIVSQTCDLLKKDITQVLLCAHFPASDYSKDEVTSIRKEHRPSYHMIEACEIDAHQREQRVIDFRTVYTLPKDFVLAFIKEQPSRLRLMPPYREHMAQAFARYFMRVGLPRNLKQ
jgi:hypothetical protein